MEEEEEEEEEARQHPGPEILHSKAHKSCLTFTNSGLVLVLLTGRQIPDLLNFFTERTETCPGIESHNSFSITCGLEFTWGSKSPLF